MWLKFAYNQKLPTSVEVMACCKALNKEKLEQRVKQHARREREAIEKLKDNVLSVLKFDFIQLIINVNNNYVRHVGIQVTGADLEQWFLGLWVETNTSLVPIATHPLK
jgi:hypothetical protein